MPEAHVVVIGAGVGGLVAALELAAGGQRVTLLERAPAPGGKMREVEVAGARVDSGPTVFTMRWVFEELLDAVGESLSDHLQLEPASLLARHAWDERSRFDLYADDRRSEAAVGELAGAAEARRFREFCARARRVYATLEKPFIRAPRPGNPMALARGGGLRSLTDLWHIKPFDTLWNALGDHFHDPRLRQLFGRYATYCGSSPFHAPATLMLVAHVEREGVWLVRGGMHRVAQALAGLASRRGATLRYDAPVERVETDRRGVCAVHLCDGERIACDAVVANCDVNAVASGLLGKELRSAVPGITHAERSLSALTWSMVAEARGFPLAHHTVFFSHDYAAEFEDIFRRRRLPAAPTVYVCAQDRTADGTPGGGPERLFCLVNAPPDGDRRAPAPEEIRQCEEQTFALMARCGLSVERRPETTVVTTPADFERMFPATGGALYGRASHGWKASFQRAGSRTRVPGLYLAGGSTHPGPGVPMAALSGRLAAASLRADLASTSRSRRVATAGGTSTR